MLPTVNSDTLRGAAYAAEVGGRAQGVALMTNLVPDAEKRAGLERAGARIIAASRDAMGAYGTRVVVEFLESRLAWGKGRGVDRGFDAAVSATAEQIRTSLPDRNTANPDYRAIFKDGTTSEYVGPAIKQDPELCAAFRRAVEASAVPVKANVIAVLDTLQPLLDTAASGVRGAEEQVNNNFTTELAARKKLVDILWEERKTVEQLLGRGGRGVARFVFFDFRPAATPEAAPEVPPGTTPPPGPGPQ